MKRTSKYLLLKLAQSTNLFVFRPATKLYPRFSLFFAPGPVFQVVCVVAVYSENAKNKETTDFNRSPSIRAFSPIPTIVYTYHPPIPISILGRMGVHF